MRRGFAYVFTMGVCGLVGVAALAAVLSVRSVALTGDRADDAAEAAAAARSGIEMARARINALSAWRTSSFRGGTASGGSVNLGRASVFVTVSDPADGDVTDDPYQSVQVTSTATVGRAARTLTATLDASPVAADYLASALHSGGQLRISKSLGGGGGVVSTNTQLVNNGTIYGAAHCSTALPPGITTGGITLLCPAKSSVAATTVTDYTTRGTLIACGDTIDRQAIGPGRNPWGTANANGLYVWRPSGDATLRRSRVVGTLVVIMNSGRSLTISDSVSMRPARPDFPVLIVKGDAKVVFVTSGTNLSESSEGANFNPTGVPNDAGQTDTDTADTYASEINGFVHVTGKLSMTGDGVIRGAVLCESTASTDAVSVADDRVIYWDASLLTLPPRGYTKRVDMKLRSGSFARVVSGTATGGTIVVNPPVVVP